MKKTITIAIAILVAVSVLYAAENIFQSFIANSGSSSISLEWRTNSENGLAKFDIERSAQDQPFVKIGEEKAKGFPSQYRFTDSEAFMKSNEVLTEKLTDNTLNNKAYTYRLRAVFNNGTSSLSDEVKVNHSINSIRRTWGMIKEMFR